MYKLRTFQCEDCGELVTRARESMEVQVCLPCGQLRAVNAARDMAARSGPYYERWLAAVSRRSTTKRNTGGVP